MRKHIKGDVVKATDEMKNHFPGEFEDVYMIEEAHKNSLEYTGFQFIKINGIMYYGSAFVNIGTAKPSFWQRLKWFFNEKKEKIF